MTSAILSTPSPSVSSPTSVATAFGAAAVPGVIACLIIATIARAAGASKEFSPLKFPAYTFFVVLGVLIGAVGWAIVRRRAADPARLLRVLVPVVLGLSLVPDVAVGAAKSMPHTTWGAVAALIVMHLVVAGVAVASYSRFLPVRR